MERGKPDMTVYTFEVPADSGRAMDYPDEELWTLDYKEADAYAREKGYLLIENEYEWQDSSMLEDYTPKPDCQWCGLPVEQIHGNWQDPDYDAGTGSALYCDEAPDHQHQPDQD